MKLYKRRTFEAAAEDKQETRLCGGALGQSDFSSLLILVEREVTLPKLAFSHQKRLLRQPRWLFFFFFFSSSA